MTASPASWQPRRVLMSLLADADGRAALAQAAQLARALGSELACVFVEESDLVALASLPNSGEMGRISRRLRPLDSATLAAEMARSLAAIRRDFSALAEPAGGDRQVEVLRGHAHEPIRRALPDDLVFYAGSLQRLVERELMEALQDAALRTAGILLPSAAASAAAEGPVVAVVDSLAGAERNLPVLRRLAGSPQNAIEIFVSGALPELLAGPLAALEPNVRLRGLEQSTALHAAAGIAARNRARLLVSEASAELLGEGAGLRGLLRELRCPLLLMNPAQGGRRP